MIFLGIFVLITLFCLVIESLWLWQASHFISKSYVRMARDCRRPRGDFRHEYHRAIYFVGWYNYSLFNREPLWKLRWNWRGLFSLREGYVEPGPPKSVYVIESKAKETTVDVLLGWEPPEGKHRNWFISIIFIFSSPSLMNEHNLLVRQFQKEPVFTRLFWKIEMKTRSRGLCG